MTSATTRRLSRYEQLFGDIDAAQSDGLEIGALDNPLTSKERGAVWYADYCSTDQLKQNHAATPTVNVDRIVPVDFITENGTRRLNEIVPPDLRFDYIVASHVAEHIPDLISWLHDLHAVLKPGGRVRLIIPNKEQCFDLRRSLSEEKDLIAAFVEKRPRPSPIQVYDFYRWHDRDNRLVHTIQQSIDMARAAVDSYVDAHCWVFTPESFCHVMDSLAEADLIPLEIEFVTKTPDGEIDFFVGFKKVK